MTDDVLRGDRAACARTGSARAASATESSTGDSPPAESSAAARDALKKAAAIRAMDWLEPGRVVGVGTGSTVAHFIAALVQRRNEFPRAVSSSEQSTRLLRAGGIEVVDLNEAGTIDVYVDGADEADPELRLIKGGGGALTREKIIAQASRRFVCIVDESKCVDVLGAFALPLEVVPMARDLVMRRATALGAAPRVRDGFVTDNGNLVIDLAGLRIDDPCATERELSMWPGVLTVGLFAHRPADVLLVAGSGGVDVREPSPRDPRAS